MTTGCFTGNIEDTYALAALMTNLLKEPYEVDHHVALANGGPHENRNLDVLSLPENRRKGRRAHRRVGKSTQYSQQGVS